MDEVIATAKLIIVTIILMAGSLLVGVWIGRRSCDEDE